MVSVLEPDFGREIALRSTFVCAGLACVSLLSKSLFTAATSRESTLIAVLEFTTRTVLNSFAADPVYAPLGQARKSGSVSNFNVIDDTDIAVRSLI